ncbi:Arabinogalactan peptide 23 like [Actinidia chinensis var. chinensis]|uniref:Arabinogalactan peptide 23 like n=1 Tax=Actinidia chinensis var. chinensis TaxID=1590841 RepID=A0A2R6QKS3_ACTCC|nr:Arabinogalactan peptide 23 like [Actinidia chinensis var. chinensis]
MEMKKIAFATLVAAVASMSAAMGATDSPAPAPANDATASFPTIGTLVGASLLSFFTYYMH